MLAMFFGRLLAPHGGSAKFLRGDFYFLREEWRNSSDLSFDSSEVSFESSEVLRHTSVENFYFPASYLEFPPWRF